MPDILKCKLRIVTFLEKPEYEALSYTLGDSRPTERIWLDGQPFAIQENLYKSFRQFTPNWNSAQNALGRCDMY